MACCASLHSRLASVRDRIICSSLYHSPRDAFSKEVCCAALSLQFAYRPCALFQGGNETVGMLPIKKSTNKSNYSEPVSTV